MQAQQLKPRPAPPPGRKRRKHITIRGIMQFDSLWPEVRCLGLLV